MTKRIELSKRGWKHRGKFFAIVDDEDFERVNRFMWSVFICDGKPYAIASVGMGKQLLMHRMVLRAPDDKDVDHKDGDGLNNTRSNLRLCNQSQNCGNTSKRNGKKYKGVYLQKGKYIIAQAQHAGKQYFLGVFDTEEEAARAYDEKASELWGEFAKTNF